MQIRSKDFNIDPHKSGSVRSFSKNIHLPLIYGGFKGFYCIVLLLNIGQLIIVCVSGLTAHLWKFGYSALSAANSHTHRVRSSATADHSSPQPSDCLTQALPEQSLSTHLFVFCKYLQFSIDFSIQLIFVWFFPCAPCILKVNFLVVG